ncbi:transcriptional regulator [Halobacteroides halobius DSM 5150]|uniref:Transcriptional regulator n=1 Tax=Halobacteroides halobius (strain ATCC 35273 / DSM 5150 / MD-1) TaxID=748449 RepID=L0K5L0_HALHC|nr:TetR/AcrR family transcriptional regulator [Halobacteroides halobius]AGB40577.1 transcriptional regulator [Halobacteroides halobius DSM 5150]
MNSKRKKIFTVAVEKFSQNGAADTTMQEIAKEAGVGKGTLYRYFNNKEDLISSLVEMGFNQLTEEIKRGIAGIDNPAKKLDKTVTIHLEFYNQHRDFCKFLTRESLGYKNKFEEHIKKIRSKYTIVIQEIIEQGVTTGKFKELDIETATASLIGMVNINALHWFMFRDEFPVTKIKNEIIELIFNGLLQA